MSRVGNIITYGVAGTVGLAIASISYLTGYAVGDGDARALREMQVHSQYQSEQIAKATNIFEQEHQRRKEIQARLTKAEMALALCELESVTLALQAVSADLDHHAEEGMLVHRLRLLLASCETIHGNTSPTGRWTFAMFRADGTAWEVEGETLEELLGGGE